MLGCERSGGNASSVSIAPELLVCRWSFAMPVTTVDLVTATKEIASKKIAREISTGLRIFAFR